MVSRVAHFLLVPAIAIAMVSALLAHGMAHATQARAGGLQQVVICADGVESVVVVDARGNPVDPDAPCADRLCPDCLSVTAAALPAPPPVIGRIETVMAPASPDAGLHFPIRRAAHEAARGPPHKV